MCAHAQNSAAGLALCATVHVLTLALYSIVECSYPEYLHAERQFRRKMCYELYAVRTTHEYDVYVDERKMGALQIVIVMQPEPLSQSKHNWHVLKHMLSTRMDAQLSIPRSILQAKIE